MTELKCLFCHHQFKIKDDAAFRECPKCGGDAYWLGSSKHSGSNHKVIDVPLKGSNRWYKEGWFKKNDKEWHNDIKSRVAQPNGDVIRVNHRGERIG